MKKIMVLVALIMSVASSALADGKLPLGFTSTGLSVYGAKGATAPTNASPLIGKTSTGVGVGMNTAAGGYSVMTQHKNGTKAYASAYDSTSVFIKDVAPNGADATVLTTGSDPLIPTSGWVTM